MIFNFEEKRKFIIDKFTGPEGLQHNIKGLGLLGFIYSKFYLNSH